jgi:hypothetical protein
MRMFSRILGLFLLVEGVWGLFSPVVFGVLTTNVPHAAIHIGLGITGIAIAHRAGARGYLLGVGALLTVVGVLFFVPRVSALVVGLLNVNFAVACLNIVIGLVCIAVASAGQRDVVATV